MLIKNTMFAMLFRYIDRKALKILKNVLQYTVVVCFFVFGYIASVYAGNVTNMRIGQQVGSVRIVFEADKKFDYKAFLLNDPKRLVVDIYDMDIKKTLQSDANNLVVNTRVGKLDANDKRVVFDLKKPAIIKKAFMLAPQSNMKWRFVVDVSICSERDYKAKVGAKHAFSSLSESKTKVASSNWIFGSDENKKTKPKKKVIVLDPGHGGKDPGAIGVYGKTYEKNITLAMGKELKAMLEKKGYTVYLTRSTDVFIPLRQRVRIAQKHKADLFMSIHADSALNRKAKGLSVYTLSEKASDKEAAALAERENKVDIIGGVDFSENSKEINDILISLSQTDSRNKSSKFATYIVGEMKKTVKLLNDSHRFAGFAVLKAPDIPSALLEMGYLSNKSEESLLKQSSYRKKLAASVTQAISRYFNDPEIASIY